MPGDLTRLLVSRSRRRPSLFMFCDVRLHPRLRRTWWECKIGLGEFTRKGEERGHTGQSLCLSTDCWFPAFWTRLAKLVHRFSIEWSTKRDKPAGINRAIAFCNLIKLLDYRAQWTGNPRSTVTSDRNNDRYSYRLACVAVVQYSHSLRSIEI